MPVMDKQVPYPYMSAKDMQGYLVENLLYKFRNHEKQPELSTKIEAVYKKLYGSEMLEEHGVHVENVCLHGTPGVGKTSSVRAAAKEVAKLLDMRLVENPIPPYMPEPNDLVISTLEMSGEVSNIVMGGIPIADTIGDVKYMNKLPLYQLSIMHKASAAILLLDDFVNAAPMVQNSALSIALEGRFQMMDLGNTYVALTANLGALDNSDVSPLSDPMTARIGHFYVEDTLEDFANRTNMKFTDALGDAGVVSFLMRDSEYFLLPTDSDHRASSNGLRTPFPCPRSWDKLINTMRMYRNRVENSGRGTDGISVEEIRQRTQAFVGKHTAEKFSSYVYAMMTGAEPISKKLIEKGEFDEEKFDSKWKNGIASTEQDFGYQMAFCLASHTSANLGKEGVKTEDVVRFMRNYAKALFKLDDAIIGLSVSEFGAKVSRARPEWSVKNQKGEPMHLNEKFASQLCNILFEEGKKMQAIDKELASTISHAVVSADRRQGYNSAVSKNRKGKTANANP